MTAWGLFFMMGCGRKEEATHGNVRHRMEGLSLSVAVCVRGHLFRERARPSVGTPDMINRAPPTGLAVPGVRRSDTDMSGSGHKEGLVAKVVCSQHNGGNFLLSSLPDSEYRDLAPLLDQVHVGPGQAIYRQGEPIDYLYFPTTAILSWVGTTRQGERSGVCVVGWEGMLGIPYLLGYEASPFHAQVAIGGEALRAEPARVGQRFEHLVSLQRLLFRYTCMALTQVAQSGLCGLYHTVEQRMCRWLLAAHDRSRGDELLLTQEMLAGMIGARRPTVSLAAGALQKSGLIRVNRGRITLLNRAGIEDATCECYWAIRREFDLFLGASHQPGRVILRSSSA